VLVLNSSLHLCIQLPVISQWNGLWKEIFQIQVPPFLIIVV